MKKPEIVIGVAPPQLRIFAGAFLAAAGSEMRSDYFKNTAQGFEEYPKKANCSVF